jgi:quercetin dioxygenase-like cupin family protein
MKEACDKAIVVTRGEAEALPVARARRATMAVLVGPQMARPRFITRRFTLAPGGRIPAHRHDSIEHEQVVVGGEMVLGLDGEEHLLRAGDAVLIPAGCAHWYKNDGSELVEFICVVPATTEYQTEWLEDPPAAATME